MPDRMPTVAARLTPAERGAVSTVAISGPLALDAVAARFVPATQVPFAARKPGQIAFGRWGGNTGEEVVVCRTGGERVEVHCHGGRAAAEAILADLACWGCEPLAWQTWLLQEEQGEVPQQPPSEEGLLLAEVALGGGASLRAAARIAMAEATTLRAAAVLLDQWHGAFATAIREVLCQLASGETHTAGLALERLLRRTQLGLHLTAPWRVVLAGRPNVGKSSLINALLGYERAIVFDQPGTTRDVVASQTALAGWPVELSDTAGLHSSTDHLEAAGIQQARGQLAAADAIVLVLDAGVEMTAADQSLREQFPEAVVVLNKSDLAVHRSHRAADWLRVSATEQWGLVALVDRIARHLVPEPPEPGTAVPFLEEHADALAASRRALQRGCAQQAAARLQEMLD